MVSVVFVNDDKGDGGGGGGGGDVCCCGSDVRLGAECEKVGCVVELGQGGNEKGEDGMEKSLTDGTTV